MPDVALSTILRKTFGQGGEGVPPNADRAALLERFFKTNTQSVQDPVFASRQSFITALAGDATLGTMIRDNFARVRFEKWDTGYPRCHMTYEVVTVAPTATEDPTSIELVAGTHWLRQVYDLEVCPEQFGARGNWIRTSSTTGTGQNDADAINDLENFVNANAPRVVLMRRKYRFQKQSDSGFSVLASDVMVLGFGIGGIVMDNLTGTNGESGNPTGSDGLRQGHGFYVEHSLRNVSLIGLHAEWKARSDSRTAGTGFHWMGYPSYAPVTVNSESRSATRDFVFRDCRSFQCPQGGAIFMGCADGEWDNFVAERCHADGLHFNCCRAIKGGRVEIIDGGDDAVAFVCYYRADGNVHTYANNWAPYASTTWNEWSNYECSAQTVVARGHLGGPGNGLRIAGCWGVTVETVHCSKSSVSAVIFSSEASGSFSTLASRRCRVGTVHSVGGDAALMVQGYSYDRRAVLANESLWRHDIEVGTVVGDNMDMDVLLIADVAGVKVNRVRGKYGTPTGTYGAKIYDSTDVQIGEIDIDGGFVSINNGSQPEAEWAADSGANYFPMDLRVDTIRVRNAVRSYAVELLNVNKVDVGLVEILNCQNSALFLQNIANVGMPNIRIHMPNRSNTAGRYAILHSLVRRSVHLYSLEVDDVPLTVVDTGGGSSSTRRSKDFVLIGEEKNTVNGTSHRCAAQTGGSAPTDCYIGKLTWNGGEASPVWRAFGHHRGTRLDVEPIVLRAASTYDAPDIAAGASVTHSVTVPGVVVGDVVRAVMSVNTDPVVFENPRVTATDTISVTVRNTGASPFNATSGTLALYIEKVGNSLPSSY